MTPDRSPSPDRAPIPGPGPAPAAGRHRSWPWCRRCSGIALDLGSARTRAWTSGRRMILDVPTVTFTGGSTVHPVRRGAIVDTPGTALMLDRLLGHRLPRFGRPLLILTAPVLGGVAYRAAARAAVEVLRPRTVLTISTARAVATAVDADLTRPLLVVDIGAHLTEVALLCEGDVVDARHTALGTSDVDGPTLPSPSPTSPPSPSPSPSPHPRITASVVAMVTAMLEQDRTSRAGEALRRGALLAGGGALLPGISYGLAAELHAPVQPVPAPHTAAVRGAAKLLGAAHAHPARAHPTRTHPD
ncbi:rod shape-determining protein [Streptomyces sp. NPDC051214]|uniref:rod shape-determining protein n=1 Tax=Streptomyces sp. NPDC051214 TaxID=3155282 RepID=UPI0034252A8C